MKLAIEIIDMKYEIGDNLGCLLAFAIAAICFTLMVIFGN